MMSAVERFKLLAAEKRFKGWPLISELVEGVEIPFFGRTLQYVLRTGNGPETYTSIIRHFGWSVVFGITDLEDDEGAGIRGGPHVITLCQWKPGVNQAGWELPPGGIGKLGPDVMLEEIAARTQACYLKETGLGHGDWHNLGHILIETGKYRGAGPDDHGLKAHLFLATNLRRIQYARQPGPNEIIESFPVPLDQFEEVLGSGLFLEESAVVCAYKALIHLGKLNWKR